MHVRALSRPFQGNGFILQSVRPACAAVRCGAPLLHLRRFFNKLRPFWAKLSEAASSSLIVLAVACAAGLVSAPPPSAASARSSTRLTVSAAISLTESLQAIRQLYGAEAPGVSITLNLGASGILQQQIQQGAPVDIFISASPGEMNALESRGLLLNSTRRNLLENRLVLICPSAYRVISGFMDLARPQVKRIAMANPESVPAGAYAQEVLEYFKLYRRIRPKIILAEDVRQVLAYVETDNAEAGLVYITEARLSNRVKVVATAPQVSHAPIVYPVAVLKRCRHAEAAEKFLQFLSAPQARKIFAREGFGED